MISVIQVGRVLPGFEISSKQTFLASLYQKLAEANGGTGGSAYCANKTFLLTNSINIPGWNLAATYRTLAETDGGTGGSAYCAQKTFSNLS